MRVIYTRNDQHSLVSSWSDFRTFRYDDIEFTAPKHFRFGKNLNGLLVLWATEDFTGESLRLGQVKTTAYEEFILTHETYVIKNWYVQHYSKRVMFLGIEIDVPLMVKYLTISARGELYGHAVRPSHNGFIFSSDNQIRLADIDLREHKLENILNVIYDV